MCGLFGMYSFNNDRLAKSVYFGLYALQHRGQESAGIVVSDGQELHPHLAMGLVPQVFSEETLNELRGTIAVGHVRYSTSGSSHICNAQPIMCDTPFGPIAIAHNGNLVNYGEIREELENMGAKFAGDSDSEVIGVLLAHTQAASLEEALLTVAKRIRGAYTLIVLSRDKLYGLVDPSGIRPLVLGKMEYTYVLASETCALDIVGAEFIRDVRSGELVVIDDKGVDTRTWTKDVKDAFCAFEFIYFARPDSTILGRNVYEVRTQLGKYLASEHPVDADIVVPVPDSGGPAAIGFSEETGIPLAEGLVKNRYVGRTFIQPTQAIREAGVRLKLNPIREVLRGKKVVLVDDSIVRGTTSRQIVRIARAAGAREVHMRISSPPILGPCFYGIDTAPKPKSELIAANFGLEEIRKFLEADSLGYLSLKSLIKAIGMRGPSLCLACLNSEYPVPIPERLSHLNLIFK